MARRRERAKDRKNRSSRQPDHHENVSGELEHASGEVEEVDAALLSGADGQETDVDDVELERQAAVATPAQRAEVAREVGPRPEGNRVLNFLRASWAELQRVQWPNRNQVAQGTAVVLGFVLVAGAYLGLADVVAQEIVDIII